MILSGIAREPLATATPHPNAEAVGARVAVIDDPGRLEALREEWTELLGASSSDEIFLTWEWLHTWFRHLGRGRPLAVLEARQGDRLVALAPLLAKPSPLGSRVAAPTLGFLGSGVVGSDYLDIIVRSGDGSGALEALAAQLDRARPVLDLVQVPAGDSRVAALAATLERSGWVRHESLTHVCPCIDLQGLSWEPFVAGLGPRHRENLRRRLRQVEGAPGFAFRAAATPAEAADAFETLVRLHRLRWNERGGSEAFGDSATVGFHRDFCRLAFERGWLRLYVLSLEGRPAAALYGFRYRDRFLLYQAGFDPGFAARSVGLVCLALAIREALAEGVHEFDLLHGAEGYKYLWARRTRSLSRFELFPPTPWAGLRRGIRRTVRIAKDGARRCFGVAGLQPIPPALRPGRVEVES